MEKNFKLKKWNDRIYLNTNYLSQTDSKIWFTKTDVFPFVKINYNFNGNKISSVMPLSLCQQANNAVDVVAMYVESLGIDFKNFEELEKQI